jgi:glycosyltransferase involved in cell wall biosynthesis
MFVRAWKGSLVDRTFRSLWILRSDPGLFAPMLNVLIVEPQMKQYRVPFFTKLHTALRSSGIDLRVAYSPPNAHEARKKDNSDLPEAIGVKVNGYALLGNRLVFQPLLREVARADLVIVDQATRYILSFLLLALSRFKLKKVGFWGHGWNRQGDVASFPERIKRHTVGWVDWWFAYTPSVTEYVRSLGVPVERISTINNSIDTNEFRELLATITTDEIHAAHGEIGVDDGSLIGLYCGGLYADKHLDFLIEAAVLVQKKVPEFRLLVLGGGPEFSKIEVAAKKYPFIVALGPRFGREKACYFRIASVFLMPGLVGLAILDAFTAELPLITTDVPIHSPEIEYLDDGVNGFIVQPDVVAYAELVVRVLKSPGLLQALRAGAARSAAKYSMEAMVENFRSGIVRCLASQNS